MTDKCVGLRGLRKVMKDEEPEGMTRRGGCLGDVTIWEKERTVEGREGL